MRRVTRILVSALLLLAPASAALEAQQLNFPSAAAGDTAALTANVKRLAHDAAIVYRAADRVVYLGNLFRLQTVAGQFDDAVKTLAVFQAALGASASEETRAANFLFGVYARAMSRAGADRDAALRRELGT